MTFLQERVSPPAPEWRERQALLALLELSKTLLSGIDLDALLNIIVSNASSVVDADRTSIYLYDAEQERLWTRVAQGMGSTRIELSIGSGIAGDVARSRQLANIPDAYQDERFNPDFDRRSGYHTRSVLCAPIVDGHGALLGVIQSVNKNGDSVFDEHDESLMLALASHVAIAIERTRSTELRMENERYEESLRVASDIQLRMLPRGLVKLPFDAKFDLSAFIRPARQVGGDLYDFFWDEQRLFFVIGDVSGKGIGAALLMAVAKTLFRANASLRQGVADVMSAVNARLYEESDPTMFVTAFCGSLDLQSGVLRYCSAGHERPLLIKGDGSIEPLQARPALALGVFPEFKYVEQIVTLHERDALFLFTDGVTEATNGEEELYSIDRLRELLAKRGQERAGHVIAAVSESVDQFVGKAPQYDDLTMMLVRYQPAAG
jgi:serine phosphatase RsbU (regulator of sigma subunit)